MDEEWGPQIEAARNTKGWSQGHLANLVGTNQPTIDRLEKGHTKHSKWLEPVLVQLGLKARGTANHPREIEVVGYVGAGGALESHYYADGQGTGEFVPAPRNSTPDTKAVQIKGVSLGPAFNGWLVFYDDVRRPPAPNMLRQLCVVELVDGRVLVKRLFPGSASGLYTLYSNGNDDPIEDVAINWAALVTDITPRR